jgi:hypothetical protein
MSSPVEITKIAFSVSTAAKIKLQKMKNKKILALNRKRENYRMIALLHEGYLRKPKNPNLLIYLASSQNPRTGLL